MQQQQHFVFCAAYRAKRLMSSLSSVVFWLILTAVNSKTGSSTLCDIANVYETLGRFLSDLNLLSEVCIGFSGCCTNDELFQLSSGN